MKLYVIGPRSEIKKLDSNFDVILKTFTNREDNTFNITKYETYIDKLLLK